jgi:DNA-binding transcriptional ArsR family regulator
MTPALKSLRARRPRRTPAPPDLSESVKMLSALAHDGRLTLMRQLIQAGPEGCCAGDLADFAGIGATTASAQLGVLANADLVSARRDGRMMIYTANYAAMEGLLGFLIRDCCCDRPEICAPLSDRLSEAVSR